MVTDLEQHVLFTEASSVAEICTPLEKIGISGFIFIRRFSDGSFIDMSNQIKWSKFFLERYFLEKYTINEIQDHMFILPGISLWELNPDNVIWHEGIEHFNYGNGISMCYEEEAYVDVFCFYTKKDNVFMNEFYLKNIDLLRKFCDYFLEKAQDLIEKGDKNRLFTPGKYLMTPKKKDSFSSPITDKSISTFIQKITLHHKQQLAPLTKREQEVLLWAAKGKTAWETSMILGLAQSTVQEYITNSMKKLVASSKVEAVAKAIVWNCIDSKAF